MKILKILLYILCTFVALFLIITIFLPSEFNVERKYEIQAPTYQVFYQIITPAYWEKWDPWMEIDPQQKRTYGSKTYGAGSNYSWTSSNSKIGNGTLSIASVIPMKQVDINLTFDMMSDTGRSTFTFEPKGISTIVTWKMHGKMSGFKKWLNLMMDGMLGKMFDKGLAKLKDLCEKLPLSNVKIEIAEKPALTYLFITDSCTINSQNVGQLITNTFTEIMKFLAANKMKMSGSPMVISNSYNENKYCFDAAIPINTTVPELKGRIKLGKMPEGRYLFGIQKGPYEQSIAVNQEINKYINDNKLKVKGRNWEAYANDPGYVKPYDIITEIYYQIER